MPNCFKERIERDMLQEYAGTRLATRIVRAGELVAIMMEYSASSWGCMFADIAAAGKILTKDLPMRVCGLTADDSDCPQSSPSKISQYLGSVFDGGRRVLILTSAGSPR